MKGDIDNLWQAAEVKPMVNQVLCHISSTPLERIHYCQEKGIVREAYSPVAYGEILKNKESAKMAKKYDASVAQLCNRYDIQLNTIALPRTANHDHSRINADVDFVIFDEDRETLKKMRKIETAERALLFSVYGGKNRNKNKSITSFIGRDAFFELHEKMQIVVLRIIIDKWVPNGSLRHNLLRLRNRCG